MQRHNNNEARPDDKQQVHSHLRRSVERRRQINELKEKRKEIFKRIHEYHYNEQNELRKQLADLESTMDALHQHKRKNLYSRRTHRDFDHYYKHIRYSRIAMLLVTLLLWVLLFILSGPATGFKVVILVLAAITSASNVFELIFLMGVKNRILKPIDNLAKGVAEIMKGNYTVVVDVNTNSEISDLTDAFNDMSNKLYEDEKLNEEYEQNRRLLIANISHDLKTPITSIQGYIEAISDQQGISEEKVGKYLTIINHNAQYMNRLIDDLFLFSKLDMQKLEFNFTLVNARHYMADLMEEFRLELSEKHAVLTYLDELSTDSTARIDPKRLHQVVRNIIDNAKKYGPETGLEIKTRLYTADNSLCLDITNNGPGIPADQLDKIFDRFYRIDTERTKDTASTGLGLAIAKELVVAHGGQITAKSTVNEGTCFTIMLPEASPDRGDNHEEHTHH
jgi:signal transduction histidine kinase